MSDSVSSKLCGSCAWQPCILHSLEGMLVAELAATWEWEPDFLVAWSSRLGDWRSIEIHWGDSDYTWGPIPSLYEASDTPLPLCAQTLSVFLESNGEVTDTLSCSNLLWNHTIKPYLLLLLGHIAMSLKCAYASLISYMLCLFILRGCQRHSSHGVVAQRLQLPPLYCWSTSIPAFCWSCMSACVAQEGRFF